MAKKKWYQKRKRKGVKVGELTFALPRALEGFLIAGMIFLLFMIDVIQNLIQQNDLSYVVTYFTSGYTTPAINLLWIGIGAYIVFFLLVFARSLWEERATGRNLDLVFGIIGGVGIMFIIAGIIAGFTHAPPEPVSWFYFVPQITFYHIGMGMQILAGFYYAITK